jgi:hypothetical protein
MAAPATTTRTTPQGKILPSSQRTLIAFARKPNICFHEFETGSPGKDGGEAIEITSHHNVATRTFVPRVLYQSTPFDVKVFYYDPKLDSDIDTLLNENGSVTIRYSDGSTLDFYGYLQNYQKDPLPSGGNETAPSATITVHPTNYDPVNRLEVEPVLTEVAGT